MRHALCFKTANLHSFIIQYFELFSTINIVGPITSLATYFVHFKTCFRSIRCCVCVCFWVPTGESISQIFFFKLLQSETNQKRCRFFSQHIFNDSMRFHALASLSVVWNLTVLSLKFSLCSVSVFLREILFLTLFVSSLIHLFNFLRILLSARFFGTLSLAYQYTSEQ